MTLNSPETPRCNIANHSTVFLNKKIGTNPCFVQSCLRVNTRAEMKLVSLSVILLIIHGVHLKSENMYDIHRFIS